MPSLDRPKKLSVTIVVTKPQEAILARKTHSAGSLTCPSYTNFSTEFQVELEYHLANKLSPANARAVIILAIEIVKNFCKCELINL